jgi:hypothetical protein
MQPRYSIRALLGLVVLFSAACLALVKPSPWWIVPMPVLASISMVYAIERGLLRPAGESSLSGSMVGGIAGYALTVLFVQQIFRIGDERDVWVVAGIQCWNFIHGELPYRQSDVGNAWTAFYSFLICLHVILAAIVSAISAMLIRSVVGLTPKVNP